MSNEDNWRDAMGSPSGWLSEIERIDRVRDDLFITGFPGALTVERQPGWHIITVAEELVDDIENHSKMPLYFASVASNPEYTIRSNRTTLESIRMVYEQERLNNQKVLIHCAAGIERAATAVCYILSEGDPEAAAMTTAYHQLVQVRPEVSLNSILNLSTWRGRSPGQREMR